MKKKIATALAALVGASVLALPAPAHAAQEGDFRMIAHRGSHPSGITENTRGALKRAHGLGAPSSEIDLRLTSDRKLVVMHDRRLDRTTTCSGLTHERTKRQIRHGCRAEDGQMIPFATNLLAWAGRNGHNLVLEIKRQPLGWTEDDARVLANLIERRGMRDRVRLLSFSDEALRTFESVAPWLPSTWIATRPTNLAEVTANGVDAVSIRAEDTTCDTVRDLQEAGYGVLGRNRNTKPDWNSYAALGMDGFLTDMVVRWADWKSDGNTVENSIACG